MLGFEWLIIIIIIDGGGDCLFCLCSDFSSEYSGSILSTKKKKNLAIGWVTVWGRAGGAML